jgi:hypothetical protein
MRHGRAARFPHRAIPGVDDAGAAIGARDQRAQRVDAANAVGFESSRRGLRLLRGKAASTFGKTNRASETHGDQGLSGVPPLDALALNSSLHENWSRRISQTVSTVGRGANEECDLYSLPPARAHHKATILNRVRPERLRSGRSGRSRPVRIWISRGRRGGAPILIGALVASAVVQFPTVPMWLGAP